MRSTVRSTTLATLFSLLSAAGAAAQGILLPPTCGRPMGDPVNDRPMPRPICVAAANVVRQSTDVRVRLTDRVLRYEVEERFVNRGSVVGEADYVFPLPKNAAFQDFQLEINGELVSGETYGADEARRMYEEIVRKQRDPALVEWMGYGMLRARIFPIAPGETKRVVVRFQSVAQREGDALRIDYFPSGGRSATENRSPNTAPVHLTVFYPDHAGFGRPYSPTHELDVNDRGSENEVTVRGDAHDATILLPIPRADAPAISVLANARGNEDGFAMITVAPPDRGRVAPAPRDITLVLDISGSMQGQKMEQARAAGRQLLETLTPQDRFRMIDFSTDVHTFRDDFVAATPDNLAAARRYLDDLQANGSTNIEGALREATHGQIQSGHLPMILFITDGEPTIGERDPIRLAELAKSASHTDEARRIFTFGLGADVNVVLLEQLALEGRGTSQFVRPEESVERAVGLVASRLVDPVLTDVRVHAEGNVSLNKMLPAAGADLFAGQDLVLFARYHGDGQARVVVEGRQNGRAVQWTTTANFPERANENSFVGRLWASERIGFLSTERHRNGGSPELDDEIRSLGERFGIPTELTSYFVTEPIQSQVRLLNAAGVGGTGAGAAMPAMAPAPRSAVFDAARMASAQREAKSVAQIDSVASRNDGSSANEQRVNGHRFTLVGGVWTDAKPAGSLRVVTVRAYSAAYFDLMKQIPDLAPVFSIGEQVRVVGKGVVIEVRTDAGSQQLSGAEVSRIAKDW